MKNLKGLEHDLTAVFVFNLFIYTIDVDQFKCKPFYTKCDLEKHCIIHYFDGQYVDVFEIAWRITRSMHMVYSMTLSHYS